MACEDRVAASKSRKKENVNCGHERGSASDSRHLRAE